MKVCPTCKSRCFDDMNTCYGCMHKFDNDKSKTKKLDMSVWKEEPMDDKIPEFFELESFPVVEDEDYFRVKGAHEKTNNSKEGKIKISFEIPKSVFEKYIV